MERSSIGSLKIVSYLIGDVIFEIKDITISSISINLANQPTNGPKKFVNCEFTNGGRFEGINIRDNLIFEDCIFTGNEDEQFIFNNIVGNTLLFRSNNQFNCKLVLENISNNLTEIGGQFSNDLIISGGACNLNIRGPGAGLISNFKNITLINSQGIKSVLFRDLKQEGEITFRKEVSKNLNFAQGNYDIIQFENIFDLKALKFGSLEKNSSFIANQITLQNLTLTGKVAFINADIKNLNMAHLNNKGGDIVFRSTKFTGDIQFEDSELENVKFIDSDFHKAKLYFDRSVLDKVVFSNITWTPNHEIDSSLPSKSEEDKTKRFKVLTEVYRQLKKNALSESDQILALKFYHNEMDAYWNRVKIDKAENRWNRFLIRVNKLSSNFGQSYLRPLLWILVGQLVFCISIWLLQTNMWCGVGTKCEMSAMKGFAEYFTWLIPIYKTPDHWSELSKIIGVLMRVYNGFFIYHFIKATRKFGKV